MSETHTEIGAAGNDTIAYMRDTRGHPLHRNVVAGEVLRVFEGPSRAQLEWKEDYVYREGQPLAWVKAEETGGEQKLFLHADHLGSTRQVTNTLGQQVERHDFLPFGEESTTTSGGDIALKFTGHERDQPGKPMDYMHARSASPVLGRFLRVDPSRGSARPPSAQSWNRYSYGANNPILNSDVSGRESRAAILLEQDIRAVAAGEISIQDYHERIQSRAEGALLGLSFLAPGPEEYLANFLVKAIVKLFPPASAPAGEVLGSSAVRFLARESGEVLDTSRIVVPGAINSNYGKVDFLLGRVPGSAKSLGRGNTFGKTLGFTDENLGSALQKHLRDNFGSATIDGSRLIVTAPLEGPSGLSRSIRSVWQITEEGTVQLVATFEKNI